MGRLFYKIAAADKKELESEQSDFDR